VKRARRTQLVGAALCALSATLIFWSAHRAPARDEQRAPSAAQGERAPLSAEVATAELAAPKLPAPSGPAAPPSAPTPEAALMDELRKFKDADPEFAIERAREGNRRFPDSADAPERSSILIHALAAAGRSAEARGEAETMVNHYPDSEWVREVERFTGAHRHRNAHLAANGQLAFD
jgi:hypothetical protein